MPHLLLLLVLIIFSLGCGWLANQLRLPAVLGQIVSGIILGPALLNWLSMTTLIHTLANIGVLFLMYEAGLAIDLKLLHKNFTTANRVAWFGALVPAGIFFIVYLLLGHGINNAAFSGLVFAATSISVTLALLSGEHQLSSPTGSIIIGAAVIDDIIAILGLVCLSLLGSEDSNILIALLPMIAFATGLVSQRMPQIQKLSLIAIKISQISFIPIFFASIGLQINFKPFSEHYFSLIFLTLLAIITKFSGAALAAKFSGQSNLSSLAIGAGMIARGEMALVILTTGLQGHLISLEQFSLLTAIVTLTTVLAPLVMQPLFKRLP